MPSAGAGGWWSLPAGVAGGVCLCGQLPVPVASAGCWKIKYANFQGEAVKGSLRAPESGSLRAPDHLEHHGVT